MAACKGGKSVLIHSLFVYLFSALSNFYKNVLKGILFYYTVEIDGCLNNIHEVYLETATHYCLEKYLPSEIMIKLTRGELLIEAVPIDQHRKSE